MVGRWTWGGDTSDRGCVTVPRGPGCGPQAVARCRIGPMASTILIVEDEHAVARGIEYALQQEGYTVALARSGEEGLELAVGQAPDLVILDVRLPGIDGFEVLRRLRAAGSRAAVLMLTARDDEVDKVIVLELGADDYVTKPFGLRELLRDYEALDQDEKTINVHVSHLRDKIEDDPTHPVFVQTIRGVGYAFVDR